MENELFCTYCGKAVSAQDLDQSANPSVWIAGDPLYPQHSWCEDAWAETEHEDGEGGT